MDCNCQRAIIWLDDVQPWIDFLEETAVLYSKTVYKEYTLKNYTCEMLYMVESTGSEASQVVLASWIQYV